MSRYSNYRRPVRSGRYPATKGDQRALEHVREYNDLARRLGPIVEDVKDVFFRLPDESKSKLFLEYRSKFGDKAMDYAIKTLPRWQSGEVKMSGQTASRLLNLVPRYLTYNQRFNMVKRLCDHHMGKQHESIQIDLDSPGETLRDVRNAMDRIANFSVVKSLPDHVTETVSWLNDDDIIVGRSMLTEIDKQMHLATSNEVEKKWQGIVRLAHSPDIHSISESFDFPTGSIHVYANKPSKCFIATEVFQNPNHPDVQRLRCWRDFYLRKQFYGPLVAFIYRHVGPLGAAIVRLVPLLRPPLKFIFTRISRATTRGQR